MAGRSCDEETSRSLSTLSLLPFLEVTKKVDYKVRAMGIDLRQKWRDQRLFILVGRDPRDHRDFVLFMKVLSFHMCRVTVRVTSPPVQSVPVFVLWDRVRTGGESQGRTGR